MLESRVILLCPWTSSAAGAQPRLWIRDANSRAPLGFACWQRGAGLLSWLRWWRRPSLAVHEALDEPLLCTVRRGLRPWPAWQVRDADSSLVGSVAGPRLFGQGDEPLATRRASAENDSASYIGPGGRELATTAACPEGVRLTLLLAERDSPFVKMVLLAAALVHNQEVLGGRAGRALASSGT